MRELIEKIDENKLPKHIAIIMDGNGRWAKEQGKDRIWGHHEGVKTVERVVEQCTRLGIEYLTLYAFSTENWQRPKDEVDALMELLVSTIKGQIEKLQRNDIRLKAIGNLDKLPGNCAAELNTAIEETSKNEGLTLVLALSYSARWDILNAAKRIAKEHIKAEGSNIDKMDETQFGNYLTTSEIPNPELLIRTSGENRLSNFLLWECAYSEFHFSKVHWPAFSDEDFLNALLDYQARERRFGKLSEQLSN